MKLNTDFSKRATVHTHTLSWVDSPMVGVKRKMLDRLGDEVARATTIVHYAAGSHFSEHTHTGGEEFLVLEGVFQDEHGDFPAGTYVRNPPTTKHTPRSEEGATIFVKLWQFDPADRQYIVINTLEQISKPALKRAEVSEIPLYKDQRENVRIELWEPESIIQIKAHKGLEILVIEGSFNDSGEDFVKGSWLRLPVGETFNATVGREKTRVWVKSDHLAEKPEAPE